MKVFGISGFTGVQPTNTAAVVVDTVDTAALDALYVHIVKHYPPCMHEQHGAYVEVHEICEAAPGTPRSVKILCDGDY